MRILLCNVGYLLGGRDALGGYLPRPREALFGDERAEGRAIDRLVDLVGEHRPDVACLIELDRGSHRTATDGQLGEIVDRLRRRGLEYSGRIYNKYDERSLPGRLPFFRHLSNSVLFRREWPTASRYLNAGMKRLVIETRLRGGVTLFVAHLSLGATARQRQLQELARVIETRAADRRVVVAGDLNTYLGLDELDRFTQLTGLRPLVPGETVSRRPLDHLVVSSRSLDLFLCSPDLDVDRSTVLGADISDHRPVLVDLDV